MQIFLGANPLNLIFMFWSLISWVYCELFVTRLCHNYHLYHHYCRMFSLVCAGCQQPIQPKKGQTKAPRIRALDQVRGLLVSYRPHDMIQDYHINCFKCCDCHLVLSPGTKGREPWPGTRNRVFCYKLVSPISQSAQILRWEENSVKNVTLFSRCDTRH